MNLSATLTRRESEISEWIASGYCKKEIADHLFISVRTVENTARNIYKKTEVTKAVELCIWWFCKHHNIPLSMSPLKRNMVAVIFLLIFIPFEIFSNQGITRSQRVRLTECREKEARRNEDHNSDYLIEI